MSYDLIDANLVYIILGGVVALLGLILAIFGFFTWLTRAQRITKRVEQFVAVDYHMAGDPKASPIVPRELSGSLFSRTIMNWFKKLGKFLSRYAPQKMLAETEHKLAIADNPGNLSATSFLAIRVLLLMGGVFLAYALNCDLGNIDMTSVLLGGLVIIITWLLPATWLNGRVRSRQDEITRGLPDALDMLSVCASAGLGFDQSLQKISSYWETALGYELKRVTQEMEMGVPRSEALRNMSARLDVDDLTRFISTIVQAEKIGMSYAAVLHSQALQMRVMRQLRAREIANKLPAKMILPLALFIFPAMIIVILGPAVPILLSIF
jgi:tight adherence protein C